MQAGILFMLLSLMGFEATGKSKVDHEASPPKGRVMAFASNSYKVSSLYSRHYTRKKYAKFSGNQLTVSDIESGMVQVPFDSMEVEITEMDGIADQKLGMGGSTHHQYHISIVNPATSAVYGTLQVLLNGEASNAGALGAQKLSVKDFMKWFMTVAFGGLGAEESSSADDMFDASDDHAEDQDYELQEISSLDDE
ncbi:MAG: hypothetical protein ACPGXY_02430 [Alphaproteobacteria bacterium]